MSLLVVAGIIARRKVYKDKEVAAPSASNANCGHLALQAFRSMCLEFTKIVYIYNINFFDLSERHFNVYKTVEI